MLRIPHAMEIGIPQGLIGREVYSGGKYTRYPRAPITPKFPMAQVGHGRT